MKPTLITVGEPAGIGSDCIIRAYLDHPDDFKHCIVVAPARWLQQRAGEIQVHPSIRVFPDLDDATHAAAQARHSASSHTLYCWNPVPVEQSDVAVTAAQPSAQTADAVVACIEAAAKACLSGRASALVTGPIEKAVLRNCGFDFPGHTEFLDHLSTQHSNEASNFVMMLASEDMRVALLTTHIALRDVASALSTVKTLQCLRIVAHDLRHRFGIAKPRLALCGLNPHAGEQGHFGREEIDILAPAVLQAQSEGIEVTGPLPADTIFSANVRQHYDAIVCCYHDQALIPLKALSFGEAVNVTLGLPFIRTSVDHGTALDRVGSDDVSYTSLLAAMRMAGEMSHKMTA